MVVLASIIFDTFKCGEVSRLLIGGHTSLCKVALSFPARVQCVLVSLTASVPLGNVVFVQPGV